MSVEFVLGFCGLNTAIDEIYTAQEWAGDEHLPSNTSWAHVTVANEADKRAYIRAQNRYLEAAWTPNQSRDEREENARIMTEAQAEMNRLVAKGEEQ